MSPRAIRVLWLSRYGRQGASSRLRGLQFLPHLISAGFSVDVSALFDNNYVQAIQEEERAIGSILTGYVRRLLAMHEQRKYDIVWVENEFLPWVPDSIEGLLLDGTIPFVVDYDDAIFHRYDQHQSRLIRTLLGRKIDKAMGRARVVVVGNKYLAERAIAAGARQVEILPTVVDFNRYTPMPDRSNLPFCVGWIGQGSTVQYLRMLDSTMRHLYDEAPVVLRVVGPAKWSSTSCPFQLRGWSEASEVTDICAMDVGVMPLRDDDWERNKCGYKLIQYMAAGLPVVASPVGANAQIVDHGVTGFLANNADDWLFYLRRLRDDLVLRRNMGDAGRRKIKDHYSLQVIAPRLAAILRCAVEAH